MKTTELKATTEPFFRIMRTEIKDVDPRNAAAFVQDIIDDLEITEPQATALIKVLRMHGLKAEIWEDASGCHNASPDFSG